MRCLPTRSHATPRHATNEHSDKEYWYEAARSALRRRLQQYVASGGAAGGGASRTPLVARNVIIFVGDGLGVATATAARILRGQREGLHGEDAQLAWDKFPAVALSKTYNADRQIGESSACATALLCGVKANYETVGLDASAKLGDCLTSYSSRVPSLVSWAQQQGKATGLVTNTRVTHATPAALYAHSASRFWEDDAKMTQAARKSCKDIARQLVEDEPGRNLNVVLGGGRRHWLPKVARDPEPPGDEGRRLDGRNLIDDWLRDKRKRGVRGHYVWNRSELAKVDPRGVDYLLGLFSYSHMDFEADRGDGPESDPSLADMTRTALRVLQKNPRGFLLFIEGGRIDHAHHVNNPYRALDETLALEDALLTAMGMVDLAETLLVVTSDHSHVMTLGGLATSRGNPILGVDSTLSDVDGQPYSTLLYGNGPGYSSPRTVPAANNASDTGSVGDKNVAHGSAVPRQWATHGGEDVPLYAQGPLANILFSGVMDQSYIPHAVAYAACLGEHAPRCHGGTDNYSLPVINQQVCGQGVVGLGSGSGPGSNDISNAASPDGVAVIASSVMSDDAVGPNVAGGSSGVNTKTKGASAALSNTKTQTWLSIMSLAVIAINT